MTEDRGSRVRGNLNRLSGPRKPARSSGPNSRWPPYVQYLVVVGITVLFLLLAVNMQRHHFLSGEYAKFRSSDR
jgi:hypothetical protein